MPRLAMTLSDRRRRARVSTAAVWLSAAALFGPLAGHAAASDVHVYMSTTKRGMPVFTDVPDGADSRLVFTHRAPPALRAVTAAPDSRLAAAAVPLRFAAARPSRSDLVAADVLPLASQAARRHGLDVALVMALIDVESRFQRHALSPAGAMGLMQLMPQTAIRFGVDDPWNAQSNINAGTRYLSHLLTLFGGDVRLALAGYNAGEGNVIAAGWRVPRFSETQRYVPAVLDRLRHWSAALRAAGTP